MASQLATAPPLPPTRRSLRHMAKTAFGMGRANPHVGPTAVIIVAVLLANGPFLLGLFDPNPVNRFSGLGSIVHKGILPGTYSIDPNIGQTSQSLGHLAALDILHGHLPWWNPFEGVGTPLAGEMNSAALFPGTILLIFSNGQLYLRLLFEGIAGIATYRLLLRLEVSRWISASCGVAFALNGTFAWFGHAPINPIAFLPVMLLGAERARTAAIRRTADCWGMIAIAIAFALFAGFPEVAYLDGVFAAAWIVVRSVGLERLEILAYAKKIVAGLLVGLLIAMPIIVVFADYLRVGYIGKHATGFNTVSLPHAAATVTLFPYSFGPIQGFIRFDPTGKLWFVWGGGYLTTSILFFAFIGLFNRRLRWLRFLLAAWVVFSLGRAFGVEPFLHIVGLIPLMKYVDASRYLPPSWEFAAIALAALGLDDIRRKLVPARLAIGCLIGSGIIAIGAFLAGDGLRTALEHSHESHLFRLCVIVSVVWGFGILGLIAAALFVRVPRMRMTVLCGCLVIDAFVMFMTPEFSAWRQVSLDTAPVTWLKDHLGNQRFYTLGPIVPNYGSYFGISSINMNDDPIPKTYGQYIRNSLDDNVDPLTFVGDKPLKRSGPSTLEEFEAHISNYEAIGVAYVVSVPHQVPRGMVRKLGLQEVYADAKLDIFRLPASKPLYSLQSGKCKLADISLGRIVMNCATKATLVRRELLMQGWSVTVNGHPLTLRGIGLFQAVVLRPGKSVVVFSFLPPFEQDALVAFLVGLVLLVWGCWATRMPWWGQGESCALDVGAPRADDHHLCDVQPGADESTGTASRRRT